MTAALDKMKGKHVLLGVTGSIAAYKAATIASRLVQSGAEVTVLMTRAARKFITPLTFESLSHRSVVTDMFKRATPRQPQPVHISLADSADALLIAPASATTLARLAHGMADDILSCTALSVACPVIIAPAMDAQMYAHAAVQANLRTLAKRGCILVEPEEGRLASGKVGKGRLADFPAIYEALAKALS